MIEENRTLVFTRAKLIMLFVVLWVHISVLDLFIVVQSGPRFFWQQSIMIETLSIHLSLALFSTLIFYLFSQFFQWRHKTVRLKKSLKSEVSHEL